MDQTFHTLIHVGAKSEIDELAGVRHELQRLLGKEYVHQSDTDYSSINKVVAENVDTKIPEEGQVIKRLVELAQERNINYIPSHEASVSLNDYCTRKGIPVRFEIIQLYYRIQLQRKFHQQSQNTTPQVCQHRFKFHLKSNQPMFTSLLHRWVCRCHHPCQLTITNLLPTILTSAILLCLKIIIQICTINNNNHQFISHPPILPLMLGKVWDLVFPSQRQAIRLTGAEIMTKKIGNLLALLMTSKLD
jgi:hypothetical protein